MIGEITSVSVYPYGYLSVKDENHEDGKGNPYLDKCWKEYESLSSPALTALRSDVLGTAYCLFAPFGGYKQFVQYQCRYAKLGNQARAFLLDTQRFIETGKRNICIESWMRILKEELELGSPRWLDPTQIISIKNTDDTSLGQWIAHDGGFRDMLWSLKILFGNID